MAATKKTPPGIKKPAPRSSKVVPITPREIRQAVSPGTTPFRASADPIMDALRAQGFIVKRQPRHSLRQKLANWLESRVIPRLRRA